MLMDFLFRRVFRSAGASKSDGVRSTSTDRTFVLPKVGELVKVTQLVATSSPFGLGLFFVASISAPPNESSTIAQHINFVVSKEAAPRTIDGLVSAVLAWGLAAGGFVFLNDCMNSSFNLNELTTTYRL